MRQTNATTMRITYDTNADAIYIGLKEGTFAKNREVEPGVVLDLGPNDELLGIEILDASTRINIADIANVSIEMPLGITRAAWRQDIPCPHLGRTNPHNANLQRPLHLRRLRGIHHSRGLRLTGHPG